MPATFILSLDCEGKWGVADHYDPAIHSSLGYKNLRPAYADIRLSLERFEIPSTFAFVGLFGTSARALHDALDALDRMPEKVRKYLQTGVSAIRNGEDDGWAGEWALDLVKGSRVQHELAMHGATHVPWAHLTEAEASQEFALLDLLDGPVRDALTYIFPRNQVNHTSILARAGFRGYRAERRTNPVKSILSEFNIFSPPDPAPAAASLVRIPAGYFLNWRKGLRRAVPMEVTALRFKRMLKSANERNQILHLWLHPENIASAPETLQLLNLCLAQVRDAREAGTCVVMTQRELVDSLSE